MACLVVFAAAIVAFFRPLPKLWMGTRPRALAGVGVAFGLFVLTAIVIPPPAPSGDGKKSVAASDAAQEPRADSPAAEESATPSQKVAATEFYKSMFASLKGCDVAAKETANVIERMQGGSGSVYDGYSAATAQVAACRDSWREAERLDLPADLSAIAEEAADKAKETCANTALAKQMVGETAQEVFDGNMKPSKIEEMKQRAETAQAGVMACAVNTMAVAMKSGVDIKDLPKID